MSQAEKRRETLAPFVAAVQLAANAAQTAYHNAVVRSAGCLVLAFLSLALDSLSPQDWPSILLSVADPHSIESVLVWLDAIAIFFVLVLFLLGLRASRRWIAIRASVEFLRQYQFFYIIFSSTGSPDAAKTQFDLETAAIRARVQAGSITAIVSRIERFWLERRTTVEKRLLAASDVTADAVLVYLQRRVRRQLGWFSDSKARLEHIAARRNVLILSFYYIAVALAVLKLFLFLSGAHSAAYLMPLLLIVTGMSTATTAYYINQNSRSLIHRYSTQQRRITEWLEAFNSSWKFAELPSRPFEPAAKDEVRARILQFENLMIEELIDWVHITGHDTIELAP